MADYGTYIDSTTKRIEKKVDEMKCQPVLFVGSGLSNRYFGGPNWRELLEEMAERCPLVEKELEYYFQRGDTEEEVGQILSEQYYEWAWGAGRSRFPDELYEDETYDESIYLKHEVAEYFKSITPDSMEEIPDDKEQEIKLLQEIQPHAIITTNYDTFLESLFPDYQSIVGEEVLRTPHQSIGEIYKIHGDVSTPDELVLTEEDYKDYAETRKYLTSKLLTYFAEHPVLIAGYGVGDDNVRRILADIDKILAPEDDVVENIFFLDWSRNISEEEIFETETRFQTVDESSILLNYILSEGFEWVYRAFGSGGSIEGVNLKLLRTVMANAYDIVASKAPRKEVNIDYKNLKRAADSEDVLGTMFGVSVLDNPPDFNIIYRYRLSDVAEELGYSHWHYANELIEQIEDENGVNIKEFDNVYHIDTAFESDYAEHKYSEAAIELLSKVDRGKEYELDVTSRNLEEETEALSGISAD
jgi:hypothetical protein